MINLFQPLVGDSALSNLKAVFESGWLGRGDEALKFEQKLAKIMEFHECSLTTVASCSDAIRVIVEVLKNACSVQSPNIIMPVNSFPVLASAAVLNGFKIRLCDIDPDSGNICPVSFEEMLDSNTVAAFVTHYGGNRADIEKLRSICGNIFILEDSACALGSKCTQGKPVGYNADAAVWSFDAMKLVVCGEGGAASIKSEEFLNEFKCRAYLGLPAKAKSGLDAAKDGGNWWEYDIVHPSYRSVFTNINAAIGLPQLATVKDRLNRKREIRLIYEANLKVDVLEQFNCSEYSNYFFTIRTSERDHLARYLKDHDVYTSLRYWRLDKTQIAQYCEMISETPNSDKFFGNCLNLPIHDQLTDQEIEKVISSVNKWVDNR